MAGDCCGVGASRNDAGVWFLDRLLFQPCQNLSGDVGVQMGICFNQARNICQVLLPFTSYDRTATTVNRFML